MRILPQSAYEVVLPPMYRVEQRFDGKSIDNLEEVIGREIQKPEIRRIIKPGMRIALLVGSRGICNLERITYSIGKELRDLGAEPFIIPAMGSHGGGNAQGQSEVLEGYGITEKSMKMQILSCMDVDEIGKTPSGISVCIDRIARQADMIVPIGRVKPHTDFKGPVESGLCKMLTIGLGKHEGCTRLHQQGFYNFPHLIPEAAQVVIDHSPVGFGVAIIENSYDKTFMIECVPAPMIHQREPELLDIARAKMPSIMLKEIDALVIELIGKDISGAGMDPNITGRTTKGPIENFAGPKISRIIVKGITPASHGNACGIGLADYILKSCGEQIDLLATYTNTIGSGNPEAGRIPIQVENEREGILASLLTCPEVDYNAPRIVKIKSTLDLREISVSERLLTEVAENEKMVICEEIL